MSKQVFTDVFTFPGHMRPPVVGSPDGTVWRKKTTQTAGTPTVQATAGLMALALDNTNEAQVTTLYFGDDLSYVIGQLLRMRFWLKVSASLAAATSAAFGLAGATNDTITSVAQRVLFRLAGNNNVVLNTTDGTNSQSDIATGQTVSTTLKMFEISFTNGTGDVRFFMDNADGNLRQVAPKTTFNLSAYTSGLQPFFRMQKSANAATGTLSLLRAEVEYRAN